MVFINYTWGSGCMKYRYQIHIVHFINKGQPAWPKRVVYLTVGNGGRTSFKIFQYVSKLYYLFSNAAYIFFVLLIH